MMSPTAGPFPGEEEKQTMTASPATVKASSVDEID
jgi:hypothetical protein